MDALLGLLWLLAAWLGDPDQDPECLVLGGLDAVRAEAFATVDPARLDDVYVDRRAAREDVDILTSYRRRGFHLEGMALIREFCRVSERAPDRVVLEVVDRLGPTWARSADGSRRRLPRDRPTHRTVVLEQVGVAWRVAEVHGG